MEKILILSIFSLLGTNYLHSSSTQEDKNAHRVAVDPDKQLADLVEKNIQQFTDIENAKKNNEKIHHNAEDILAALADLQKQIDAAKK